MSKNFSNEAIPALSVCESPIEGRLIQAMFDSWTFTGYDQWGSGNISSCKLNLQFEIGKAETDSEYAIGVALQATLTGVPRRRFDLVIMPVMADLFAVELDGFEHHSSREAFTRDRQNDRVCGMAGVSIFRFSGPEIYECPSRVVEEIKEICDALDSAAYRDIVALRRARARAWLEDA